MTFPTWHEPVRLLEESTAPATDQQREIASTVGLALAGTEPRGVAAVLLEEHLQPLIWGGKPERATDRQRMFLVELGSRVADDAGLTKRTASAWIEHHLALRSIEFLQRLALVRDDAVIKRTRWRHPETARPYETLDYAVVSSIGANGMVYFRGGNGKCGWPSSLTRAPARTRRDDYPKFRELPDGSMRLCGAAWRYLGAMTAAYTAVRPDRGLPPRRSDRCRGALGYRRPARR